MTGIPSASRRCWTRSGARARTLDPSSPRTSTTWSRTTTAGSRPARARRGAPPPGPGLGGPARFLAHRFGARVTALDLNAGRCLGNATLSRLVRLHRLVRSIRGDAQQLPFRRGAFDAAISQEGLLHVPDKGRVLREGARVLRPGGRIAFSDWIAAPRLQDGERRRLRGGVGGAPPSPRSRGRAAPGGGRGR